jgi:hypothetical protein
MLTEAEQVEAALSDWMMTIDVAFLDIRNRKKEKSAWPGERKAMILWLSCRHIKEMYDDHPYKAGDKIQCRACKSTYL